MANKILIIGLFLALSSFTNLWSLKSSNHKNSTISGLAPYLGQTPPGETPVVFTPPIASPANRSDLKIVFSADGKESLIGVRVNDIPTILYAKDANGHWTKPETANFVVANQREKEPFFSPDGRKIFFIRYSSIWVSNRIGQSWATPEILGSPINVNAEQYHPTVTLDGTLYFCSNRGGEYNIYRSKYESGRYSTVEKLDAVINSHVDGADGAYDPYISPDESYIIFASVRSGGYGKEDHYISFNKGGHWTNPKNLGSKINTAGTEYGSVVSPDNQYYFFARSKSATGDFWQKDNLSEIYWVRASFIDNLRHTNFIPYVKSGIPNRSAMCRQPFQYALPDDAFIDDDGNSTLTYSAALENGDAHPLADKKTISAPCMHAVVVENGDPLPVWLNFNPGTRTFSGTPTEPGTVKIKMTATDPAGATAATTWKLTVANEGGL